MMHGGPRCCWRQVVDRHKRIARPSFASHEFTTAQNVDESRPSVFLVVLVYTDLPDGCSDLTTTRKAPAVGGWALYGIRRGASVEGAFSRLHSSMSLPDHALPTVSSPDFSLPGQWPRTRQGVGGPFDDRGDCRTRLRCSHNDKDNDHTHRTRERDPRVKQTAAR